jgi:DnaK suppressor protein
VNDQEHSLEFYKQQLIALRRELTAVEQMGSEAAQPVELDQTRMGRLTRMDAMQAQAISVASKNRRQAKLKQVEAALARIEKEVYGSCCDCGEQIGAKRLEFDPTALFCIVCAEKAEG